MKCEIIKDLLPSYVDGLTSEESNMEIEEHMKTCSHCKEILEQMKCEVVIENANINKEKIKPFKKVNSRVWKAILITLLGCIIVVGVYSYFFEIGWGVNSEDMSITFERENDTIQINFELTDGKVLTPWTNHRAIHESIKFTECYSSILDDRGEYPNKFSYGYSGCVDKNGKFDPSYENQFVTLKFKDKTETIYLKDIAKELGVKQ